VGFVQFGAGRAPSARVRNRTHRERPSRLREEALDATPA
jgi:hypothetical protein